MISGTLTTIERLGGDMFKNMKIPVENNLDEIVRELKEHGYYLSNLFELKTTIAFVVTNINGGIISVNNTDVGNYTNGVLTTLAELKEM